MLSRERHIAERGPETTAWIAHYSKEHDEFFYFNTTTGVSRWDRPAGYQVKADEKAIRGVLRLQNAFRSRLAEKSELLATQGSKWIRGKDSSGVSFLYNVETKEFRW